MILFTIITVTILVSGNLCEDAAQSELNNDTVSELNLNQTDEDDSKISTSESAVVAATAFNETIPTSQPSSKVECIARNITDDSLPTVQLINSTAIQEYVESLPNATATEYAVILFYYPWCVFSTSCAAHFNALGRLYPQLHVLALDAYANTGINMRFGLVGVPSVLFIHNGKVVAKYNDSEPTIEGYASFINTVAGLSPVGDLVLVEADQDGPVPTKPIPKVDYVLILSWIFIFACFGYMLGKSVLVKQLLESIRTPWREAEAQHEHLD